MAHPAERQINLSPGTRVSESAPMRGFHGPLVSYALAVIIAFCGLLIRLPFSEFLGDKVPYITFFLATAVSAKAGGFGPGLVTTVVGAFLAAHYIVPPVGSVIFVDAIDYVGLALFIFVSGYISYVCEALIRSRERLSQAQLAEAAQRELLQQTLLCIGDGVVSTTVEKRVRLMNPVAEELTGWSVAEAMNQPVEIVLPLANEETGEVAENPIDKALTGIVSGLANHTELVRRDGRRIPIADSGAPIRDESGSIVGAVIVFRDVSEERLAHEALRRSNEELARANRELEEFAYVSSHDLQEPLRMVNIYTQKLVRTFGNGNEDAKVYSRFIERGVKRMDELIRDLLSYSRVIHAEPQPVGEADLAQALASAISVLQSRIEETGATIASGSLPTVRGDDAQFAQVFQNLLSNSLKYQMPDVRPEIQVSAHERGNKWIISIRDNGIGFEPEYATRIFGLFKRLHKDAYPGTGIGLAICERIVERAGGRIWAESQVGQGAVFHIELDGVRK